MTAESSAPRTGEFAARADDAGLIRGVGRWAMVALMINAIVGAGIFGLPSKIHALAGTWALLALVACAAVVACIALCFAEVASRFTHTGGPYLYTRLAFGPLAGFLVGWLMWITRVAALAAIANVMTSYLAFFWPAAGYGAGRAIVMSVVMVALTLVNLVGVRSAAGAIGTLTLAKLAPLLLFVGVGVFFLDPHRFAGGPSPDSGSFSKTVLQLIFAFGGFEAVVIAAGETRDPRRDLPFALFVSIAIATLLYLLIQVVCIGTLPGLGSSEKPLADASGRFMGAVGASLMALGALIATVGTMCGSLLLGPRMLFAMAERDQLPRVFARIHPRFRTPHVAILLTATAGLGLAVSGTFVHVLSLSVIARLTTYAATAAALLAFRRRDHGHPALFSVPAGGAVVAVTLGGCLWLLTQSGTRELRDVAIGLAAGLCLYAAQRAWRVRAPR